MTPIPIQIETPYDTEQLPDGTSEADIRVFDTTRIASGGPMAPLSSYVDVANKTTIVTLTEQANQFINGVLKPGERPEKAPASFSESLLKPVLEANPASGIPMIKPPEPNTDGDLRLGYPIDFPGARPTFKPAISIGYSAQTGGGNIADGWRLSAPTISVETRWGVPIYDAAVETETYLFNGEQLVPEAGDYLSGQPDDEILGAALPSVRDDQLARLQLVPQPHRTTRLRPRKTGKAHFVLRRDEGLWRFVRHGDAPQHYWWEAWQENPSGDVKVMYFGRAPGRLLSDIPLLSMADGSENSWVLRRDASGEASPIMRWGLAREKDVFGNLIDYEWKATCVGCSADGKITLPEDRDLYLARVIYTHHAEIEETILRCSEDRNLPGCRRKQAVYEVLFNWESDHSLPARSESRSGGITVSRQLLSSFDYRLRRRAAGDDVTLAAPQWKCTEAFLRYAFTRRTDPLFPDQKGARRWLQSVDKKTAPRPSFELVTAPVASDAAFFPKEMPNCAGAPSTTELTLPLTTRFDYHDKTKPGRSLFIADGIQNYKISKDFGKLKHSDLLNSVAGILGNDGQGPFSSALLGSSFTADTSGGLYLGIGNFNKAPGGGINVQFSNRTTQAETTLLLDVDGDGISDLLTYDEGIWTVHKGQIDESARLSFSKTLDHRLPFGFRFQFEPTFSSRNVGFEAHLPGGMGGNTSGNGRTVQRNYLADMDGDGRIDVVTPGGVFYNRANRASASHTLAFDDVSGFIGAGAATSVKTPVPINKVPTPPAMADLSAQYPRYDGVRLWRAPFDGHVMVTGRAAFVGPDDELAGNRLMPDIRVERSYRERDGVLVSVERSSGANVNVCDRGILGPGRFTPPPTPVPTAKGTWSLGGSLSVVNSRTASYFVRLNGFDFEAAQSAQLQVGGLDATQKQHFEAAVVAAVRDWNDTHGQGAQPLSFSAGSLIYSGAGEMQPLVITFKVEWPAPQTDDDRFSLRLATANADSEVETRVYKAHFIPERDVCATERAVAAEMAALADKLGIGQRMFAAVKAGDVLYFRVHSIDEGSGDAVDWNPSVTYMQASRRTVGAPEDRDVLVAMSPKPLLVERGVVRTQDDLCSIDPTTPLCRAILALIAQPTTLCSAEEVPFGLCDGLGRSQLRYRPAPLQPHGVGTDWSEPGDWPILAIAAGEFRSPTTGRFKLTGGFKKPTTPGSMQLRFARIAAPMGGRTAPICNELGHDAFGRTPGGGGPGEPQLLEAGSVPLRQRAADGQWLEVTAMDTDAGEYEISALHGSHHIAKDQKLCLAFRHLSPMQNSADDGSYWPFDAAQLQLLTGKPITVEFDRVYEFVPAGWFGDGGEGLVVRPQGTLRQTPTRKWATEEANEGECGPKPMQKPEGTEAACAVVESPWREAHFVSPRAIHGSVIYVSVVEPAPPTPMAHVEQPVPLVTPLPLRTSEPTSTLCTAPGEVERRVQLDVAIASQLNPGDERPVAKGATGHGLASLRSTLAAWRTRMVDGKPAITPVPLPFRLFAIRQNDPGGVIWKRLEGAHLGMGSLGAGESYVEDPRKSLKGLTIDFSRTELTAVGKDPNLMAGTAAHVHFQDGSPSGIELPPSAVGLAFCAQPDDLLSVTSSLDGSATPDPPSQERIKALLAVQCSSISTGAGTPEKGCPITSANLSTPVEDGAQPRGYRLERQRLAIGLDPLSRSTDGPGFSPFRATLLPPTPRGAHVVAIKFSPAALACDPLVPAAKNCLPNAAVLAALGPLPAYSDLIAREPFPFANAQTIKNELESNAGTSCDASQPPGDPFPGAKYGEDNCQKRMATAPLQVDFPIYPLGTSYRVGQYAADPGSLPADKRGRSLQPATGPPLLDRACSELGISWRREGEQSPLTTARQGQRAPEARVWSDPRPPNLCGMGPDSSIFVFDSIFAASRLGRKNIHQGERRELKELAERVEPQIAQNAIIRGGGKGLQGLQKLSESRMQGLAVAGGGLDASNSTTRNGANVDMIDMNGDGFPDLIAGSQVVYSDPSGGIRCLDGAVWNGRAGCGASLPTMVDSDGVRIRGSRAESWTLGAAMGAMTKTFAQAIGNAQGQLGPTLQGIGRVLGNSTVMAAFGAVSANFGRNKGNREYDIIDVNNDGLPDLARVQGSGLRVRLNVGYRFTEEVDWQGGALFKDIGQNRGLGVSPSYSTQNNEFSGGMATTVTGAGQNISLADVNGDGLVDVVDISRDGDINVRFGTGSGLSVVTKMGKAPVGAVSRGESDRVSVGGSFTILIPIPFTTLVIVINPNFARSETLTRQTSSLRDMDGDGLPDLAVGEGLYKPTSDGDNPFGIGKLKFSNRDVSVHPNALAKHGLLSGVYFPTNPSASANYSFDYARTGPTELDPHHRYVLALTIVRDGVSADDFILASAGNLASVQGNERATCHFYADGFYDRFDRKFLGYARVDTLEACRAPEASPDPIATHVASLRIMTAGDGNALAFQGLLRSERRYANRTAYEAGLLLEERVFDLAASRKSKEAARRAIHTYVLADTAAASHARRVCNRLRSPGIDPGLEVEILKLGFVRDVLAAPDKSKEKGCDQPFEDTSAGVAHNDPIFEVRPLRLVPVKVQTIQETREDDDEERVMRTALQFETDHLGRTIRACDLGAVDKSAKAWTTRGAVCTGLSYDETVRPAFTHGASGGGTILVEQRNRVRQVAVAHFRQGDSLTEPSDVSVDVKPRRESILDFMQTGLGLTTDELKRLLRRRSAAHDPGTGAVVALCAAERIVAGQRDPCDGYRHFPSDAQFADLKSAAAGHWAMRSYAYDSFGNLRAYISPMAGGASFTRKDYRYDAYLNLVETSERTHLCGAPAPPAGGGKSPSDKELCLGKESLLNGLLSAAGGIDYRFAAPTVNADVNGNVTFLDLDGLGRPSRLYVSWVGIGSPCDGASLCSLAKTNAAGFWSSPAVKKDALSALRLIGSVAYAALPTGPVALIERQVRGDLFSHAPTTPVVTLRSANLADQLGETIQTITSGRACRFDSIPCDDPLPFVASPLVLKDSLGRPAKTGFAKAFDAPHPHVKGIIPTDGPGNVVSYDGRDRVRIVSLPDGNAFDMRYGIMPSLDAKAGGRLRHVAYARNAVCAVSAIERDVRGAIRTVVESAETTTIEGRETAELGSGDPGIAGKAPPLFDLSSILDAPQQVALCKSSKRGEDFALSQATAITAYDRDTLGQLVAVRLPQRSTQPKPGENAAILIGYDALGRRQLVNDPDRGFERIVHDAASNPVCRYNLPQKKGLDSSDFMTPERQAILEGGCPVDSAFKQPSQGVVRRLIETKFVASLPIQVKHEEFGDDRGQKRTVSYEYGAAGSSSAAGDNQIGRPRKITDGVGTITRTYDGLGRPISTVRGFETLKDFDAAPRPTIATTEEFDVWGLPAKKTMRTSMPGLDNPLTVSIDHTIQHLYNIGGQLIGQIAIDGRPAAKTVIVEDIRYDERGNQRVLAQAGGVVTRNEYASSSNRLIAATVELSPMNGLRRLFQNLTYRYDPSGNVVSYINRPAVVARCPGSGDDCPLPFTPAEARAAGLLIGKSESGFAYDQLNRIRRAKKSVMSAGNWKSRHPNLFNETDKEGEPQLLTDSVLDSARELSLTFDETFAFSQTHEMSVLNRRTDQSVGTLAFPKALPGPKGGTAFETERSLYTSDNEPRHAPGTIDTTVKGSTKNTTRKTEFYFDDFGRMHYAGCDVTKGGGHCLPYRFLHWNADDSLRLQIEQTSSDRVPEAIKYDKKGKPKPGTWNYRIHSAYDHAGSRVHKQTALARYISDKGKVNGDDPEETVVLSDTVYADANFTIARRKDQVPQVLAHHFVGGVRVASQWLGDKHLFSYHTQLLTRNVTDVVLTELEQKDGTGAVAKAASSRLLGQQEYAAFGAVLHEREIAIDPTQPKSKVLAARRHPGLPPYRFNAKEEDDSGLQDFGARFYDNRMAIWVRPDPVIADYLDGKRNGGIYSPPNLASYGFGWGNPTRFIDKDGRAPAYSDGPEVRVTYGLTAELVFGGLWLVGPSAGLKLDFNAGFTIPISTVFAEFSITPEIGVGTSASLTHGPGFGLSRDRLSSKLGEYGGYTDQSTVISGAFGLGAGSTGSLSFSDDGVGLSPIDLKSLKSFNSPRMRGGIGGVFGASATIGRQFTWGVGVNFSRFIPQRQKGVDYDFSRPDSSKIND